MITGEMTEFTEKLRNLFRGAQPLVVELEFVTVGLALQYIILLQTLLALKMAAFNPVL